MADVKCTDCEGRGGAYCGPPCPSCRGTGYEIGETAEDMTYEPVTDVTALRQRVAELERQLNAAIVGGAQLERENAELQARLVIRDELADAVRAIYDSVPVASWTHKPMRVIRDWLASLGKQVSL